MHISIGIISIVNGCPSKMSIELIWSLYLEDISDVFQGKSELHQEPHVSGADHIHCPW